MNVGDRAKKNTIFFCANLRTGTWVKSKRAGAIASGAMGQGSKEIVMIKDQVQRTNKSVSIRHKWWQFHKDNPHVYDLVERFTFDVIKRGYDNYSINSVFERIRWHTDVETKSDQPFKLSNNHRAYYARLFMAYNPSHSGFFRVRKFRSE